jgi:RNA polymerase subunit RPABC4/transcription elongation factor Spt4
MPEGVKYLFLLEDKMAFCGNCGTKNEEGIKFCSNCGNPLTVTVTKNESAGNYESPVISPARVSVIDHRQKAADEAFCSSCGATIKRDAEICPRCGVRQRNSGGSASEKYTTLLWLSILLGEFGVDRFYVGKIGTGLLKLVTGGGCLVWWVIDVISILSGKFTDSNGNVIEKG